VLLVVRRRRAGRRAGAVRPPDETSYKSSRNSCSVVPGAADTTPCDVGRLIVLWISALEILVHSKTGDVGMLTVLDELEKVEWVSEFCTPRRYKVWENRKHTKFQRRPLAPWICSKLYQVRNAFIHGKPVSWRNLRVSETTLSLLYYASGIYRTT